MRVGMAAYVYKYGRGCGSLHRTSGFGIWDDDDRGKACPFCFRPSRFFCQGRWTQFRLWKRRRRRRRRESRRILPGDSLPGAGTRWGLFAAWVLCLANNLRQKYQNLLFPVMLASTTASAFFPVPSSSSVVSAKASLKAVTDSPENLGVRGNVGKPLSSSGTMEVKAQAQALPKVNGTKIGLKIDAQKIEEDAPSASRTFYNQLPDWSFLLAAITTIFLAAEKQFTLIDWKPRRPDMLGDAFDLGKIMQDGLVFRQNFSVRSYEIGADGTASIETLMNHLQEAALNHVRSAGLLGDGFGSTPQMSKRNLIWVVTKMQVLVEQYPSWEDVVEVDTWVAPSGKHGMRRDWHVHDYQTGQTVLRATSVWVMMNKQTRRLSKLPEEVREEIGSYFVDREPVINEDSRKLPKLEDNTADYVRRGLTPRWGDLDINQHVNNVKYIGWILESVPTSILESHELAGMTLEYRRECGRDSMLQSLSAVSDKSPDGSPEASIECQHLLRMECGAEIVRCRTDWRPKRVQGL